MSKQQIIDKLNADIATTRELREIDKREIDNLTKQLGYQSKRISEIAAENESLRADKKWLQQMHSGLLQSIPELLLRTRNALPR